MRLSHLGVKLSEKHKKAISLAKLGKPTINPDNLITLCYSCHGKTMHKREYWKSLLGGYIDTP